MEDHPNVSDCFVPRAGLARMQSVEEGDVSKKSYKRLHRWRYSPTVAYGNNEVYLHPYHARRLYVADALAIQTLPASFSLPSDIYGYVVFGRAARLTEAVLDAKNKLTKRVLRGIIITDG